MNLVYYTFDITNNSVIDNTPTKISYSMYSSNKESFTDISLSYDIKTLDGKNVNSPFTLKPSINNLPKGVTVKNYNVEPKFPMYFHISPSNGHIHGRIMTSEKKEYNVTAKLSSGETVTTKVSL